LQLKNLTPNLAWQSSLVPHFLTIYPAFCWKRLQTRLSSHWEGYH